MSIQKEIILRYKSSGHVRFQIPERLCSDEVAGYVADAINEFDGVYRVNLFRNKHKLAIRYTEENLTLQELVQQLIKLLTDLEKKGFFNAKPDTGKSGSLNFKLPSWKGTRWAKEKYTETKETAQAISILAKLSLKKNQRFSLIPKKS